MQCNQVRKAIPSLIDGFLNQYDIQQVEAHLAGCVECRQLKREFERDSLIVSRHLASAPWTPVAEDVDKRIPSGDGWRWLRTGGQRLAAGAGVALVVLIVVVSALVLREMAGSDAPLTRDDLPATTDSETVHSDGVVLGINEIEQIVERLDAAGLVQDFDTGLAAGTTSDELDFFIAFPRIAVHRHITLLQYEIESDYIFEIDLRIYEPDEPDRRIGKNVLLDPIEPTGWIVLDGYIPSGSSHQELILQAEGEALQRADDGSLVKAPITGGTWMSRRQVDLSKLKTLPPAQLFDQAMYDSGIEVCCLEIERGAAVSRIRWQTNVVDPDALQPFEPENSGDLEDVRVEAPWPRIMIDGEPVRVIDTSSLGLHRPGNEALVLDLPSSGALQVSLTSVYAEHDGDLKPPFDGNWTFEVPLDLTRDDEAEQPDPEPGFAIARDIYMLAADEAGQPGIWRIPAGDESPELLVDHAQGVATMQLLSSVDLVAYSVVGQEGIRLADLDGNDRGRVELPDDEPSLGIVISEDGVIVASVTRDPTRIWIGGIDATEAEVVYESENPVAQMQWSPDGEKLAISECYGPDGCGILVISVDDGSILWRAEPQINHLDWHPSDPDVFSYSTEAGVFMADLGDGSERQLASHDGLPGDGEQFVKAHWVSDTEMITLRQDSFGESPPEGTLWRVSVEDGIDPESAHPVGPAFDIDLLSAPDGSVGILIARLDEDEQRELYLTGFGEDGLLISSQNPETDVPYRLGPVTVQWE